jgi:hypothetical protein
MLAAVTDEEEDSEFEPEEEEEVDLVADVAS